MLDALYINFENLSPINTDKNSTFTANSISTIQSIHLKFQTIIPTCKGGQILCESLLRNNHCSEKNPYRLEFANYLLFSQESWKIQSLKEHVPE